MSKQKKVQTEKIDKASSRAKSSKKKQETEVEAETLQVMEDDKLFEMEVEGQLTDFNSDEDEDLDQGQAGKTKWEKCQASLPRHPNRIRR